MRERPIPVNSRSPQNIFLIIHVHSWIFMISLIFYVSHPQVATYLLDTTQKPTSFPIIIKLNFWRQYNGRALHISLQAYLMS